MHSLKGLAGAPSVFSTGAFDVFKGRRRRAGAAKRPLPDQRAQIDDDLRRRDERTARRAGRRRPDFEYPPLQAFNRRLELEGAIDHPQAHHLHPRGVDLGHRVVKQPANVADRPQRAAQLCPEPTPFRWKAGGEGVKFPFVDHGLWLYHA
jgi:hypothetical protein